MERHLELREAQELDRVGVDAAQLEREPIVLDNDGEPVAAVISYAEFQQYRKWKGRSDAYQPSQQFLTDNETFKRMLPDLMKTHRDKYVAVYQGELVDSADTLGELARRVYARFGYTEIYMDQVAEPRVYRITSAWVVRK